MMTRKLLRRMMIELIVIAIISVFVLAGGAWLAGNKADERQQSEYSDVFYDVLPAADYKEIHTSDMELFTGISHVYAAYDDDGIEKGYIIDVTVTNRDGSSLHMLEGILLDGATVSGIKRINDEAVPVEISDEQIGIIASQITGRKIPMALESQIASVSDADDTVTKLGGLIDGTYYAQRQFANRNGYIDYVEIDVNEGIITRVQWDAFNTDPTTPNRREASLTGAYTVSGENWATQSYNLCHALIDLQDPARLAMKSDGTTEIVDGVTANIRDFVELAEECIANSRAGYTKTDYYNGMDRVFEGLFGGDAESLGLVNDDGFVVYSFDDYPDYFKVYDNAGNVTGELNIREFIEYYGNSGTPSGNGGEEDDQTVTTQTDPAETEMTEATEASAASETETYESNESEPTQYYDGSEDGVVNDRGDSLLTDSVDGIPMNEIMTYIEGISDNEDASHNVITGVNIGYRFLKQYLNWLA